MNKQNIIPRLALASCVALALAVGCKPKTPDAAPPDKGGEVAQNDQGAKPPARTYMDPPPPTAPKPVQFPELQKFTLEKNKLPVYVVENHEVPLVSAQLVINAGTMDDEHLAEMAANMLGEGTKKRTKAKIDEAIEYVGSSINAGAGVHNTFVTSRVLTRDLDLALDLIADEVMNPKFPADALDKLKNQAKTGLKAQKQDSGFLADTLFDMVAYPEGHPYGRPIPTEAQIDAITVDSLKQFHDRFYRSNNAYLILSGDITVAEAKPKVAKALGKWKAFTDAAEIPKNPLNKYDGAAYQARVPKDLVVHLVDRPASAQAEIRVGNLALARKHPDWPMVDVAAQILGGGSTGRLFLDIREERGLTYGIYSFVSEGQAPGTFKIWTKTKTKKTADMLKAIFEHLTKMQKEDPTEQEYHDAVTQIVGSFPLELETPGQIAGKVHTLLTYGLPEDYFRTYRDKVLAVKREDIKATATKYMFSVPIIVIVGKADKIEPQIKQALPNASIVHYDTELNRK
ncbi:MAG: pitrilysin family protein [Nannocystaceae bacterium]|nr:insulinase family protein [Myxococcales bacterium]